MGSASLGDVYKRQGLGNRTNTILQSAFFRITGVIPVEQAVEQTVSYTHLDVYKRQVYNR